MSPEKWWLEDEVSLWNGPFSESGVTAIDWLNLILILPSTSYCWDIQSIKSVEMFLSDRDSWELSTLRNMRWILNEHSFRDSFLNVKSQKLGINQGDGFVLSGWIQKIYSYWYWWASNSFFSFSKPQTPPECMIQKAKNVYSMVPELGHITAVTCGPPYNYHVGLPYLQFSKFQDKVCFA